MSVNDQTFRDRATRRRERVASSWRADPKMQRMRLLLDNDPDQFDRAYGASGRISLGLYERGERAAAGLDPEPDPEEAA